MGTTVATPPRTREQRMRALEQANDVRSYRKVYKQRLGRGDVALRDALMSDEERLQTMKLYELLLATPRVGRVKANKLLAAARVSPSKTLGDLTKRQREELLRILRVRHRSLW